MEVLKLYPDNNVFSYLKWRGDIDLKKAPFNEIDALVLSLFSYTNLSGLVTDDAQTVTVKKVAKEYFSEGRPITDHRYYQKLLKLMAHAERFKNAKLSYYEDTLTNQTQFSAVKITLENNLNFIAFRGTDDSIVGWKEDFEISFRTTIAQKQAKDYLERILKSDDEHYTLGGHSKGGNLAEYAALNVEPKFRNRIDRIYTFDSPGIAKEVGAQLQLNYLKDKLIRFVPEYSIIGRLFEPEGIDATIVQSSRKAVAQHDAFSWEISGSRFITHKHANPQARVYNQIINDWIGNATLEERESLTNDLFDALAASGSNKITELSKNGLGGFGAILISLTSSSRRTRFVFGNLFSEFWQSIKQRHVLKRFFTVDSIIGWIMLILGIITLTAPQYSMKAFGILVALTGVVFSAKQIIYTAISKFQARQKRFFTISWLVVFGLSISLLSNNRVLIFLAHYFLGIFLIIFSYIRFRQIILQRISGIFRKIVAVFEAILAFALGIIVVVNPHYFTQRSVLIVGIILVVYGFFKLIAEIFGQKKRLPKEHR